MATKKAFEEFVQEIEDCRAKLLNELAFISDSDPELFDHLKDALDILGHEGNGDE